MPASTFCLYQSHFLYNSHRRSPRAPRTHTMPESESKSKPITDVQDFLQRPHRCRCRLPMRPEPPKETPKGPSKLRSVAKKLSILKKIIPTRLFKAKPKETTTPPFEAKPKETTTRVLSRLELLPMELLLEIAKYADPVSTACLRATNHYFRAVVPSQPLNTCARALLIARFENDMDVLPEKLICILCKRKVPRRYFCPTMWVLGPDWTEFNRCVGLLTLEPSARFCVFHVQQYFNRRLWDMITKRTWVNDELGWQRMARMCTHCSREYEGPGGCVCGCEICEFAWQPMFDRSMVTC